MAILRGFGADDTIFGTGESDNIMGFGGSDTLYGRAGYDLLDGGDGADLMIGGIGDDTYRVDHVNDRVDERWGEGFADLVYASVGYRLFKNIENLVLTGTAAYGIGNELDNHIIGNEAANRLDGGGGNDILEGGKGDDTYFLREGVSTFIEHPGEGNDTLRTSINDFVLPEGLENLWLLTVAVSGTGNAADNRLFGNELGNSLEGAEGADVIEGRAGDDTLTGGTGRDRLYGGDGNDYLIQRGNDILLSAGSGDDKIKLDALVNGSTVKGGSGFDTLILPRELTILGNLDLRASGFEAVSQGYYDRVSGDSSDNIINFSNVASLYGILFNGAAGDDVLRGTAGDDYITGGDGNDVISGLGGADIMSGGPGDDIYYVSGLNDKVYDTDFEPQGNSGFDVVYSTRSIELLEYYAEIEELYLVGKWAIKAIGSYFDNAIIGNEQDNILDGSRGNDSMTGGAGSDRFQFSTPLDEASNVDAITDLTSGEDVVELWSRIFSSAGSAGTLADDAFHVGSAAEDAEDRIVYDASTGMLYYDEDGTGSASQILFATFAPETALTSADFIVY